MEIQTQPLDDIGQLTLTELDEMPLATLEKHINLVNAIKDTARHYEAALHASMNKRFSERAAQLRQEAGKSTGTVRFEVDGFVVIADLLKRPEYDQAKLKGAVDALRNWGENPDDYVGIEIKVSETKYNAWPPAVRELFEPARTLKVGKPTYKLEQIKAGVMPDASNDANFGEVL